MHQGTEGQRSEVPCPPGGGGGICHHLGLMCQRSSAAIGVRSSMWVSGLPGASVG